MAKTVQQLQEVLNNTITELKKPQTPESLKELKSELTKLDYSIRNAQQNFLPALEAKQELEEAGGTLELTDEVKAVLAESNKLVALEAQRANLVAICDNPSELQKMQLEGARAAPKQSEGQKPKSRRFLNKLKGKSSAALPAAAAQDQKPAAGNQKQRKMGPKK